MDMSALGSAILLFRSKAKMKTEAETPLISGKANLNPLTSFDGYRELEEW
jgi:hypothetical protein